MKAIIMAHKGHQDYLRYTLSQVKFFNPDVPIILLGDNSNAWIGRHGIIHAHIKDYFDSAHVFSTYYRHRSTNDYHYDLFCFQRYFVIEEYCKRHGYTQLCLLDSDVLLYGSIPFEELKGNEFTLFAPIPTIRITSIMNGINMLSIDRLTALTTLILNEYLHCNSAFDQFWEQWVEKAGGDSRKIYGGMNDMISWNMYCYDHASEYVPWERLSHLGLYHKHMNVPYLGVDLKTLPIVKKNHRIFLVKDGKELFFFHIHFQGGSKSLIPKYYSAPVENLISAPVPQATTPPPVIPPIQSQPASLPQKMTLKRVIKGVMPYALVKWIQSRKQAI